MIKNPVISFIYFCGLLFGSIVPPAQAQDDSFVRRLLENGVNGATYLIVRNCFKEIAIDPPSLSTRNFVAINRDNYTGEVNWRNTFGGMTGWTAYSVWWPKGAKVFVISVGRQTYNCNVPLSGL